MCYLQQLISLERNKEGVFVNFHNLKGCLGKFKNIEVVYDIYSSILLDIYLCVCVLKKLVMKTHMYSI